MDGTVYDRLARLLVYPDALFLDEVDACVDLLRAAHPAAATHLSCFAESVRDLCEDELGELFTRTFDINPTCCLEVGWQLFGENYTRGEFLVAMRVAMRDFELPESAELPDHLQHVLPILGHMTGERADEFGVSCVLPAVRKMLDGFKASENPYRHVLEAVACVVADRHAHVPTGRQS
jgi:nitrate reductase assembly molybdenum cofactor insertion protein NarJ